MESAGLRCTVGLPGLQCEDGQEKGLEGTACGEVVLGVFWV
jgi:hypothetical protein